MRRTTTRQPTRDRARAVRDKPRRIAILGAGGFVGSHLVPHLAARGETEIVAIDRNLDKLADDLPGVRRVAADIAQPGLLDEIVRGTDAVVSLTAICNPALYNTRPLDVIDASFTDLVPLVKLCAARRRWLIHFSTCEVYGRVALDAAGRRMRAMVEDETALFLGPVARERWTYAAAKQLLERVIWAHGRHGGLPFTIVRPFNVIGPRMDFIPGVDGEGIPRVLACFLNALMRGMPLQLVDGGRQRRSFLDVGEFVAAVGLILDRAEVCHGEILNLGNPRNDVTIRALGRGLADAYRAQRPGAPAPRFERVSADAFYGEGYDDTAVRVPSIAKATRLLGWRPRRQLPEMLPGIVTDYVARYADQIAAGESPEQPLAVAAGRRR
ncbi:MAG: NAD-dependent epimerase/dehydratase family protein [Polyangia bacterium]